MGLTPLPFSSLQLSPILNRMTDTWHIGNPTVKKKKKTFKPKHLTFSVCLIVSLSSFLLFYCSTPPSFALPTPNSENQVFLFLSSTLTQISLPNLFLSITFLFLLFFAFVNTLCHDPNLYFRV